MADNFENYNQGIDSPALNAVAVTPSDATDLTTDARSLYVGTTGAISLVTSGGDTVLFSSVPAGMILPVRVRRVNSTSTTASDMVAMY